MSNTFIKTISAIILAVVVFINSIGNFLGIGDIIQTEPSTTETTVVGTTELTEVSTTTAVPATKPTTTAPINVDVPSDSYCITARGAVVKFGCTVAELKTACGEPLDNISETDKNGNDYLSCVYAPDYSNLAVYQFLNGKLSGFYTFDKNAVVSYNNNAYSIKDKGETTIGSLAIKEYTDKHSENSVYAIFVSYDGFNYDTYAFSDFTGQEKLELYITNAMREINGVVAIKIDDKASKAAHDYAVYMDENNNYSHTDLNGNQINVRLENLGVEWYGCAENIAHGYHSIFDFSNGWYNSEGHRKAMLTPEYDSFGAGFSNLSGNKSYGVQVFYY